jgi:hypothetical protein
VLSSPKKKIIFEKKKERGKGMKGMVMKIIKLCSLKYEHDIGKKRKKR